MHRNIEYGPHNENHLNWLSDVRYSVHTEPKNYNLLLYVRDYNHKRLITFLVFIVINVVVLKICILILNTYDIILFSQLFFSMCWQIIAYFLVFDFISIYCYTISVKVILQAWLFRMTWVWNLFAISWSWMVAKLLIMILWLISSIFLQTHKIEVCFMIVTP